ncbi:MAG: glycosyltransferase family 4 protein [Lachnospiraceae bacterium]|nr:glycosyltransferase family 4 protein [Lachnospiraceae bacterium]
MKTLLYTGDQKIVSKSGVGEAVRHQKRILELMQYEETEDYKMDYDAVHINTIFPGSLLMSRRAARQGKKVIYYAHSTMEDFRNSFTGANLIAPLFKKWITFCYNSGDIIITPTDYSKQLLESREYRICKPIYSLSNGIDTAFWKRDEEAGARFRKKYGICEDQKVAVSVGHYIDRKGILDFIEMAGQMPETEFYWFGYTNLNVVPAKIRRAVRTAPANVHFPGYVSREELKEAYCGSDVFLFLTKEETEGIVLLEALACEIPVVLRDIPIYKDWLWNGIDVYKGRDIEEFKQAAEGIFSGKARNLTAQGRKMAAERDYKKVAKKLKRIYQESGIEVQEYTLPAKEHPASGAALLQS